MNGKQAVALLLTIVIALGIYMFYGQKISDLQIQADAIPPSYQMQSTLSIARGEPQPEQYSGVSKEMLLALADKANTERIFLSGGVLIVGLIVTASLRTRTRTEG
jgi:hypothetical protein